MREVHQLTLDPSGHILIPSAICARLGLTPGMTFVVEERDNKDLVLRLQEEPPIVDKDGVLVVQSQAVGDIADAVRQERDAWVCTSSHFLSRGLVSHSREHF